MDTITEERLAPAHDHLGRPIRRPKSAAPTLVPTTSGLEEAEQPEANRRDSVLTPSAEPVNSDPAAGRRKRLTFTAAECLESATKWQATLSRLTGNMPASLAAKLGKKLMSLLIDRAQPALELFQEWDLE